MGSDKIKSAGVFKESTKCNVKHLDLAKLSQEATKALFESTKTVQMNEQNVCEYKRQLGLNKLMKYDIKDEPVFNLVSHFNNIKEYSNTSDCIECKLDDLVVDTSEHNPYTTLCEYAAMFRDGSLTPSELCKSILEVSTRKKLKNLNFIKEISPSHVMTQADASSERFKNGTIISQLDGIPFVVSDQIVTEMYSYGNGISKSEISGNKNLKVVQKLLDLGAILIGVTRVSYAGLCDIGTNSSKEQGSVKNPYNQKCYCSGVSTGCCAAISSGFVPLAIGLDGVGSALISAGSCGVVGFRATYGRMSNFNQKLSLSSKTPALLTVSVKDSALVYRLVSEVDEEDLAHFKFPPVKLSKLACNPYDIGKIKIGVDKLFMEKCTNKLTISVINFLLKRLGKSFEVVEYNIPELQETITASRIVSLYENARAIGLLDNQDPKKFISSLECVNAAVLMEIAQSISKTEYEQACKQRTRFFNIAKNMFNKFDLFLLPITGTPPRFISNDDFEFGILDIDNQNKLNMFSSFSAFVGLPSLVTYHDKDEHNRPVSVLSICSWFNEDRLLSFGNLLDTYYSGVQKSPHKFVYLL